MTGTTSLTDRGAARHPQSLSAPHHAGAARHGLGLVAQDRFGGDHGDLSLYQVPAVRPARGAGRIAGATAGLAVLLAVVAVVVRLTRGPLLALAAPTAPRTGLAGVPGLDLAVGLLCFLALVALVVRAVRR